MTFTQLQLLALFMMSDDLNFHFQVLTNHQFLIPRNFILSSPQTHFSSLFYCLFDSYLRLAGLIDSLSCLQVNKF